MFRIGHGYDAHRFSSDSEPATFITLGGVNINHHHSLIAHSDGDVLLHALADALLGALALGDIGQHFPDNDQQYNNISSRILLKQVYEKVEQLSYQIQNADLTIIAQSPKMMPHLPEMRQNIASDCLTSISHINIKATTTEKMGFTGREEGIACHAVVLLKQLE